MNTKNETEEVVLQVVPKSKNTYVCLLCGLQCTTKSTLNRHMKNLHNTFQSMQKSNLKCSLCHSNVMTYEKLDKHLFTNHRLSVKHEMITFESVESFESWKLDFERRTQSSFVIFNSRCTTGKKITKYVCHRSGYYNANLKNFTRQRKIKGIGSNKIESTCPARIVAIKNKKGAVKVEYVAMHLGHDIEVARLRMMPSSKREIDVNESEVLQNATLLGNEGTGNTAKNINWSTDFGINIDTSDDFKSVEILIEKLRTPNDNPILAYELCAKEITLENGKFFLAFMNSAQQEMFKMYGSNVLMIASIPCSNTYSIYFTSVMVIDTDLEGIPVAFLWSSSRTESIYQKFFALIKEKAPTIRPATFISDDLNIFYNTFVMEYGYAPKKILFDWQVMKNLTRKLSEIKSEEKRKQVRRDMLLLFSQPEIDSFLKELAITLDKLLNDPDSKIYGEYFNTCYAYRPTQWAYCYQKEFHKKTNGLMEKWNQEIRKMNLKCKRLDTSINNVIDCFRQLFMNKLLSMQLTDVPSKFAQLQKTYHKLADEIASSVEIFEDKQNSKWYVTDSKSNLNKLSVNCHLVKLEDNSKCNCALICDKCQACIHMFSCSCNEYTTQFNMCKHIHLVCNKYFENLNQEEEEVEETIVLCFDYDNTNEDNSIAVTEQNSVYSEVVDERELDAEKQVALDRLNALRAAVTNTNNLEAVSYVINNVNTLIFGVHVLESKSQYRKSSNLILQNKTS